MYAANRKPHAPDANTPERLCDMPDCGLPGTYRAPKSRLQLREFHWFCLEHVRMYNASWDYYKGMSAKEIDSEVRADTFWQRPSWPLGGQGRYAKLEEAIEAELRAFSFGRPPHPASTTTAPPALRDALGVLGLGWPVTLETVKAKYKELAKRHHPDANNGDKDAEERLKTINLAYAALRGKLASSPASPPPPAAE